MNVMGHIHSLLSSTDLPNKNLIDLEKIDNVQIAKGKMASTECWRQGACASEMRDNGFPK